MGVYDPAAWSTFFATQAGASAVLMGLVFVAITINLGQILGSPRLMDRAGEALIQLGTVLAASTFVLAPQSSNAVGAELLCGRRRRLVGRVAVEAPRSIDRRRESVVGDPEDGRDASRSGRGTHDPGVFAMYSA